HIYTLSLHDALPIYPFGILANHHQTLNVTVKHRRQRRNICPLAITTRDQDHIPRLRREATNCCSRCTNIGSLGIVIKPDSVFLADKLTAMLQPGESAESCNH